MPVKIAESTGVTAVKGLCGLAGDLGAVAASLLDHVVHFLPRPDVVSQGNPAPACAVVRDTHVICKFAPSPEHEDHAVGLEEGGLLNVERARPPQRLVELFRALVV